ncbi:GtrA family protein [Cryobacterium sp. MDB1-18-2]|uniref:GtrA family protein n=2 Tax=Cryobacterium TaxID=69578 RepID=A0ABY2IP54_9MICO|nr:GtrA family protein [Cryobacterium sp. MDB2-A-1]TFC10884.1 GtrA family protein [Cryobacterium sp. MDB2-33-2]TFC13824.1 GtrA family protein [Cryobacterium sp. MDB2-A-2]TFC20135.1 GtrA family protein [Cryobacterium glucosi]TFC23448.1 GtrA family protein [Cryobacterium sp. MDB2-10]TFC32570.1 GtrA family protein [Cryobacterium sp. MDB1-18-2]TFC37422.1 GtrA family protein [Cryobacterium sp. MDB1-18-1]
MGRIVDLVRGFADTTLTYVLKFGVVGLCGYVVDLGLFNALRLGALGQSHYVQGPIGATIISVGIATLVTWFGNRYWTFRARRRSNIALELFEFVVVSVLGLLVSLACLWVSHYALGFESLLADNIAKNVVGLGLSTGLRFLLYHYWVYGSQRTDQVSNVEESIPADVVA